MLWVKSVGRFNSGGERQKKKVGLYVIHSMEDTDITESSRYHRKIISCLQYEIQ